jgi:hypothetical protein
MNMDRSHGSSERTPELRDDFTRMLDEAVDALKNDFVSGARQMAYAALSNLSSLMEAAKDVAKSRAELWQKAVYAVEELSGARPSMNAAVSSCLLRALVDIATGWDEEEEEHRFIDSQREAKVDYLVKKARIMIGHILDDRKKTDERLGRSFMGYIKHQHEPDRRRSSGRYRVQCSWPSVLAELRRVRTPTLFILLDV